MRLIAKMNYQEKNSDGSVYFGGDLEKEDYFSRFHIPNIVCDNSNRCIKNIYPNCENGKKVWKTLRSL